MAEDTGNGGQNPDELLADLTSELTGDELLGLTDSYAEPADFVEGGPTELDLQDPRPVSPGAGHSDPVMAPPIVARPGGEDRAESDLDVDEIGDASAGEAEEGEEEGRGGRRKRKKRDPFKDMPRTFSRDAATAPRQLTTLSQMKRIKRARVRHEGQRVLTDDVRKLKSLTVEPRLAAGDFINFYVEPVRVEYYIPKESRFAVESKFLYIPLVDPEPRPQDVILKKNMAEQRFVDLIDVMNEFPQYITGILDSYNSSMRMYESLSKAMYDADGEEELYRTAFYLCETLIEYEPSLAALEFLGDFMSWNMNWLVRRLNVLGIEFSASDKTVSLLIKKRNQLWEEKGYDYDERFEILAALFYEQAYPNRGLTYTDDDYIFGAF